MAGIHKYFQAMTLHVPPAEETDIGEKATPAANVAVQHIVTRKGTDVAAGEKGKRKYTQAQHAKLAKHGAENGNAVAERHFSKVFPGLGESTVRLFKKESLAALAKNDGRGEVNIFPAK